MPINCRNFNMTTENWPSHVKVRTLTDNSVFFFPGQDGIRPGLAKNYGDSPDAILSVHTLSCYNQRAITQLFC